MTHELLLNYSSSNVNDEGLVDIVDKQLVGVDQPIILDFSDNFITDIGVKFLATIMSKLKLEELNLTRNEVTHEGIKYFFEKIINNESLKTIDLSENEIGFYSDAGINEIAKFLKINKLLECLILSGNYIEYPQIQEISMSLVSNTYLKVLDLSNNSIDSSGATLIFVALRNNFTLQVIDLSNNEITDESTPIIAETLVMNVSLIKLDLYNNLISDEGIRKIAAALKINNTLTILDLYDTNITDVGVSYIAEVLQDNTTLIKVTCGKSEQNINSNEVLRLVKRNKDLVSKLADKLITLVSIGEQFDNTSSYKIDVNKIKYSDFSIFRDVIVTDKILLQKKLYKVLEASNSEPLYEEYKEITKLKSNMIYSVSYQFAKGNLFKLAGISKTVSGNAITLSGYLHIIPDIAEQIVSYIFSKEFISFLKQYNKSWLQQYQDHKLSIERESENKESESESENEATYALSYLKHSKDTNEFNEQPNKKMKIEYLVSDGNHDPIVLTGESTIYDME